MIPLMLAKTVRDYAKATDRMYPDSTGGGPRKPRKKHDRAPLARLCSWTADLWHDAKEDPLGAFFVALMVLAALALVAALVVTIVGLIGRAWVGTGTVVSRHYDPAHYETFTVCHGAGKGAVCVPQLTWVEDDWTVTVAALDGSRHTVPVSHDGWDRLTPGTHFDNTGGQP